MTKGGIYDRSYASEVSPGGNRWQLEDAEEHVKEAQVQGLGPLACFTQGLTKGIQEVGKLFACGEYFSPELIVGADAMDEGTGWGSACYRELCK
jgi:methanogenic corrinoid protein MtbC1